MWYKTELFHEGVGAGISQDRRPVVYLRYNHPVIYIVVLYHRCTIFNGIMAIECCGVYSMCMASLENSYL